MSPASGRARRRARNPASPRRGEQRAAEAVGLEIEIEREHRERDLHLCRSDARLVEEEDATPLGTRPCDVERAGDEALHDVAVRRLHVGFERRLARLAQPLSLVDERALRAEVDGVDGATVERRERTRNATARERRRLARDEHHCLLARHAQAHRPLGRPRPEHDFDAVVHVAPLARQQERIDLAHVRHGRRDPSACRIEAKCAVSRHRCRSS